MQIYLASASPRRKALLDQLGVATEILKIDVPEMQQPNEVPKAYAQRLAIEKAQAGWRAAGRTKELPVLGADTIVVVDNAILGKPANKADALRMLQLLSGQTHQVITAVAVVKGEEMQTACSISSVEFRVITPEEAECYWLTGEPVDKAGSYGIQEKGAIFIKAIQGSYTGIMGLPHYETAALLKNFGITIL